MQEGGCAGEGQAHPFVGNRKRRRKGGGRRKALRRLLPGNRYELRLGEYLPVEVSEETYRRKSVAELRKLVEEMTLIAHVMVEKYDCDLPLKGSRFLEGEKGQFTLAEDDDAIEVPPPFPNPLLQ